VKRLTLPLLLALCGLVFSQVSLAAGMKVEGSLPRSLEVGAVSLDITVTGVLPSDITPGRGESTQNRITVEMTQIDQSPIGFDQVRAQTSNARFFLQERQLPVELPDNNGNFTVTTYIWIQEAVPGELKLRITSGTLKLRINFAIGGKNIVRDFLTELTQDAYVVAEAPTFTSGAAILGSQKSLLVNYNSAASVAIKGGTGTKPPSQVNVFTVDPTIAGELVTLPAKKFSGQATTPDSEATCTFRMPSSDKEACVFDCKDASGAAGDIYLDPKAVGSIPGFSWTSGSQSSGQASVSGLENGRKYYVFLQYEPSGIQVSDCLAGMPSANFSMTELNGESDAKVVDVRCFIATAAYGSPLHERLRLFRKFRDKVLVNSPIGRALVDTYYRLSPPLADWISAHPKAREAARTVLEIPASVLGLVDDLY
jgi:hypothetical protein